MEVSLRLDHLVFRVSSIPQTERFYTAILGEPIEVDENVVLYQVADTLLFFSLAAPEPAHRCDPDAKRPYSPDAKRLYNKEAIGLNHLAFGVATPEALAAKVSALNSAGIPNSGILRDHYGDKDFVWLDDPDGMRLEFYLRPA